MAPPPRDEEREPKPSDPHEVETADLLVRHALPPGFEHIDRVARDTDAALEVDRLDCRRMPIRSGGGARGFVAVEHGHSQNVLAVAGLHQAVELAAIGWLDGHRYLQRLCEEELRHVCGEDNE